MKNFLHLLWFESKTRWFLAFLPIAYIFVFFPSFLGRGYTNMLASFNPGFVFIFQVALMTAPIFQNTPWGKTDPRLGSLEFAFTRAVSRSRLFWAKAAIYLIACCSIATSYLAYSAFRPDVTLRGAYGDRDAQKLGAFYAQNFPGSTLREPERKFGPHPIDVPMGNLASACAILVFSLVFASAFQLAQSSLPEGKLSIWLLIGGTMLLFLGVLFLPLLFGWARLVVSPYERFVAFIWNQPLITAAALVLFVGAVEFICCRRFLQKEIL